MKKALEIEIYRLARSATHVPGEETWGEKPEDLKSVSIERAAELLTDRYRAQASRIDKEVDEIFPTLAKPLRDVIIISYGKKDDYNAHVVRRIADCMVTNLKSFVLDD
jgi:hypothetical protein